MQLSRRAFMVQASSLALLGFRDIYPNLVLYNANIFTVDPRLPSARAVALWGDRIYAVGSNDEILALAKSNTKRVDLAGSTVLPGFIDAHTHPAYSGNRHLTQVDCELPTIAAILRALKERSLVTKSNDWVLGFKYDDTKAAEGRAITRSDLDAAVPDHPVMVEHRGGHTAYLNSAGFARAGVDERTPDPPGGRFERDPATGRLTGRVAETAKELVEKSIPSLLTDDQRREGVRLISQMLNAAGITSAHDVWATTEDLAAYQDAREAGELGVRIYCLMIGEAATSMLDAGIKGGFGDEWIRVGGMKAVCDGSISERTALLS